MKFSDEDIKRQLRLGEDSLWEFKQIEFAGNTPKSPSRDDLADEIAAFANTKGGILLCGVTDRGEVQGMTRKQINALEDLVKEICIDSIKPSLTPIILRKETEDNKRYLLVEVPRGYAQHKSPHGNYHRLGSSKRPMTDDAAMRLAQRRGQARFIWFDKQPVPDTGFASLDISLWKPLLSSEGSASPQLALEKMGLLVVDDDNARRATVAGLLVCSRNPERWLPNACITATCYRGEDNTTGHVDDKTITGHLYQQIAEAVAFAMRNMRVGAHKDPARLDLPQYREVVLFEAIVNAVVHRDYSIKGSRIRLSMYTDHLEIISPGGLPNDMTTDSMTVRQSTRNELLATLLGRMLVGDIRGANDRRFLMERRGDGVPIIQRETRALSGKLPAYELIDNSELRLTIPSANTIPNPTTAQLRTTQRGKHLAEVKLLVLFPNHTWQQAITGKNGEAQVKLYTTHLPMTVFAAAHNCKAYVKQWLPAQGALHIEMQSLPEGGSVIFPEAVGMLPELQGSINPILDTYGRTYLYTSNIAINAGQPQPVSFTFGEELRFTDVKGREMLVRIVAIAGKSSLLEYRYVK